MKSSRTESLPKIRKLARRADTRGDASLFGQLCLIEQRKCASRGSVEGFIQKNMGVRKLSHGVPAIRMLTGYIE
jgi:hypothetical protein